MLPFALSLIALVMACLIAGGSILMITITIGWLGWGMLAKKSLRIVIGLVILVIAVAGVVLVPLIQDQFDSAPVAAANGAISPVSPMPAPAAAQPSAPLLPATPMPYAATIQTVYGTQRPLAAPPTASAGTTSPAGPSDSLDLSNSGLSGTTAPTTHPSPAGQGAR
jgi:hypothetical protein